MNRPRHPASDGATLDLFTDPADTNAPLTPAATLATLRALTDAGLLRHLDTALAAQLHQQAPEAAPCVLVAAALLVHRRLLRRGQKLSGTH